ncbi:hypothetical protein [Dyella sp. A6]|uniref:PilW family protein n=1 Tax=Dyella aluminiiresistens TaxID=3069105 RepID=UPI002E77EF67|nr:hypothetical protein [Dyella sp. A6]
MLTRHRREVGFTLISMMIGMVIALISVAAMLMLYRTLIVTAKQVNTQATRDREVAVGSLVSQEEIQQAGFGIADAAAGTDLVVLKDAALVEGRLSGTAIASYTGSVSGNAIVWGYNPTAASGAVDANGYMCEGLIVTDSGGDGGGLQWLAPVSCIRATAWQELTWTSHSLASAQSVGAGAGFTVSSASCWPFGQTSAVNGLYVSYDQPDSSSGMAAQPTTTRSSSIEGQATGGTTLAVFSACLSNLHQ